MIVSCGRRAARTVGGRVSLHHHPQAIRGDAVKLYNSLGPNPKLVRMFAAEKGYSFAAIEEVDLMKGANRKEPYLSKNPAGQLPCVELDDGRVIAETTAICE